MSVLFSPLPTALSPTCLRSCAPFDASTPVVEFKGLNIQVNVGSLLRWGNLINSDANMLMSTEDADVLFGIDAKNIAILVGNYVETVSKENVVQNMVLAREAFAVMLCMYPTIKPKLKSLITHERRRRVLKEASLIYEGSLNLVLKTVGSNLNSLCANIIRKHFQCSSIGMSRALNIRDVRSQLIQLVTESKHRDCLHSSDTVALCLLTSAVEIKRVLADISASVDLLARGGLDPKEGLKRDIFGLREVAMVRRRMSFHAEVFKREMQRVLECESSVWQDGTDATFLDFELEDPIDIMSPDEDEPVDPFLVADFPGFELDRDNSNDEFAAYHRAVCAHKREQRALDINTKHKFCMLTCPDYINPYTDAIYPSARGYIVRGDLALFETAVSEAVDTRTRFRESF